MINKKWNIKFDKDSMLSEINQLCADLEILPVTAMILYNRGYKDTKSARSFICKENDIFHDPFLLRDMDIATDRIIKAIDNGEKIIIYGDYDVDGVTSVSTLYLYLKSKGADVSYHIPSRNGDGYGISISALDMLAKDNYTLLISVDTGITAYDEIEYAKTLGLDVIVTDHHNCHDRIPDALAVINPCRPDCNYPFTDLAGVGVVFKLLCGIEMKLCEISGDIERNFIRDICYEYGDLIATGTVADVMPIIDENRLIVSIGLKIIENTDRPGFKALFEQSGLNTNGQSSKKRRVTSSFIGYIIAPKINAAGRLSNAARAVELLLCEDEQKAGNIAAELCEINHQRQNEENKICEQAFEKIKAEHDFENDPVIVLSEDNWHQGVIGIVASRITDHYNMPAILISFDEDNIGKGSGRSIKGLNLVEALDTCRDSLLKFGGHELAAGLSIERDKLKKFKEDINNYARRKLREENTEISIPVDCELDAKDITLDLANELYLLEPYGIANPVPNFILRDGEIVEITSIGNNRHTRLVIEKDKCLFTAVYFGVVSSELDLKTRDKVDIVFNLDINEFRNIQNIQLVVRDLAPSRSCLQRIQEQRELYNAIKEGRRINIDEFIVPTRDEFADVYTYIKKQLAQGQSLIGIQRIERNMKWRSTNSFVKIKFIILILNEINLISAIHQPSDWDDYYIFKINKIRCKTNLDKSTIYKRLKCKQEKK